MIFKTRFGSGLRALALATACVVGSVATIGAQQPAAPDNSKVNTRDRAKTATTADQQSNSQTDLEITQKIRQAVVADKTLSTYAHNIKIVTRHGKVTLKGPVNSAAEKTTIAAKAAEVAGDANITNQISVTQPKMGAKSSAKKAGS